MSTDRYRRGWLGPVVVLPALVTLIVLAGTAANGLSADVQQVSVQQAAPPPCALPRPPLPPPAPTTITTIEQAYYCVFTNYYSGAELDDQVLLSGAFAGFTQELDRLGLDQPDATMPALTGDHDSDWAAFATVYQHTLSQARPSATQQQDLAAATMNGMLAGLDDNHVRWTPAQTPPGYQPGDEYDLGIWTSPSWLLAEGAPGEALAPLYVTKINPGSPAASAGIRPGDVIESINGSPPFADAALSASAVSPLDLDTYPLPAHVTLWLQQPGTRRSWPVTLSPALYQAAAPAASSKLLNGNIAYVELPSFFTGAASQVLADIASLGKQATLRGVILDLRGNTGGSTGEVAQLLGAFEHGTAYSYDCDVQGSCTANYPDTTTSLLHLPVVVLTDRNCVSACDAFSGAIKDLHLGTLVGTRTGGIVAGPAAGYVLDDGSMLEMPRKHEVSANHELINGIGVSPDYYLPITPADVSTGRDPELGKAVALLSA
jgi:carboxyl-terminal processing protease